MSMSAQTSAPGPTRQPDKIARFLGSESDYWRLVIRGNALTAVTLGIYRFWFATDIRRFLWSNTEIGGETLEYTGRGLELFLGFLIAIAVLLPIYVIFALLPARGGGLFALVILWLGQFAVYRARRYRLTRTIFRGVRLHQTGSAVGYAFRSFGWWFLILLTLGLAYPWAQANLERYKMRNTFYGDLPGHFAGTGTSLFVSGIGLWIVVVAPLLAGLVATPLLSSSNGANTKTAVTSILGGTLTWSVLAAILLYPAFEALTLRWWLSGVRFGDIAVTSFLRTGRIYGVWLRFLLYALLLGLVTVVVVAILAAVFGSLATVGGLFTGTGTIRPPTSTAAQWVAGGIGLVIYVAVVLCYSALYQVVVKLALWGLAVESLDIANFQMVELVKAEGTLSSPFGEGLADALDVGGV